MVKGVIKVKKIRTKRERVLKYIYKGKCIGEFYMPKNVFYVVTDAEV